MIITVGVSRRHIHLCKQTCKKLFGSTSMPIRNPLNQPGQYASTLTVDLSWHGKVLEHIRVCGPIRKYDQVELAKEEADYFDINPPIRKSGDLKGTPPITLIGPKGEKTIKTGVIMAERHIHMDPKEAKRLSLKDREEVKVYKNNKALFKAKIKIENPSFTELHIDTHEEIIYDLHQGDGVEVRKCGK